MPPPKSGCEFRARTIAAETEFWRAHRQVAGVLHFCGLAYSKPMAVTSDHFLDIEKLTLEPYFQTLRGRCLCPGRPDARLLGGRPARGSDLPDSRDRDQRSRRRLEGHRSSPRGLRRADDAGAGPSV